MLTVFGKDGKSFHMGLRLDTDIQYVKGVGPKLGALLERSGIKKVSDLIEFFPRTYEDQRAARSLASLRDGEVVGIRVQVVKVYAMNLGRSSRRMYDVLVKDSTGQIHCKYFRVPYKGYFERLRPGIEVRVVGKVTEYRGRLEFHHPDIRDIEPGAEEMKDQLLPIYVEVEGLSSSKIHRLIEAALRTLEDENWEQDTLPDSVIKKENLISRKAAILTLHQPQPADAELLMDFIAPAQIRLIFEELFLMELFLAARRAGVQSQKGIPLLCDGKMTENLLGLLPFKLTKAQLCALEEIRQDLRHTSPMQRLVQGDVGCGKTIVCFLSVLHAIESGYQACLMAPTEILAEQHFENAKRTLGQVEVRMALLSSSTRAKDRRALLEGLEKGEIDFLIGTHSLIEEDVKFMRLALAVIDEQHRFGVDQRSLLRMKGANPHFLVMTATPIPRTLALTVYGDLDLSIIKELPSGRAPIQTRVVSESKREPVFEFMKSQVQKGRQAYVVLPLVSESEKLDLKNAVDEYESLKKSYPELQIGLLHGKMASDEKDEVMDAFRKNQIQVLVSTTVIEVGVDVPNANMMIIEHAERFGLSQLHQLRGRVGRGGHASYCVLVMGYAVSEIARERLAFMEKSQDGFKIAEFDLEIRGPGEFLGTRQSGLPGFRLANLVRDREILLRARQCAFDLILKDPRLDRPEHQRLKVFLETRARKG